MIDLLSMLLLIAAEPESATVRVIRVAPSQAEAAKAQQEADAATAKGPRPEIVDPMMGLSSGDYPAESIRANEEGNVRISVEVDAAGKPTICTVMQSSGHQRLDEKTCLVAMERASFRPARDKEGKAVASSWLSPPIRWVVPKGGGHATLQPYEFYHATTIQLGADGTLGECTVDTSGNITIPDACEQAKARHAKNAKNSARWWKSLTDVIIVSNKDVPPDISKPEWGLRQSRVVSAQLQLSDLMPPVACETIITEGWAFGGNGCPPPDKLAPILPNPDWSKAKTSYSETSIFGQLR